MPKCRIAIVDDEPEIAQALAQLLQPTGAELEIFFSARAFLTRLETATFNLLICDWIMPDVDGIRLIRRLRRKLDISFPILILTARNSEADIVTGLSAGADDYIAKPVSRNMLHARVAALLRREYWRSREHTVGGVTHFDGYAFDSANSNVTFGSETVSLSVKEYKLAALLFSNPEKVYSRQMLAEHAWGANSASMVADTKTINTHMYVLRKKLKLHHNGFSKMQLKQVYGIGYVLTRGRSLDTNVAVA